VIFLSCGGNGAVAALKACRNAIGVNTDIIVLTIWSAACWKYN